MSEENNWKVYRAELHETMSKGACVPFLGQFLTQILHPETMKESMLHWRKSTGHRPKSGNLNADNQEMLSTPTTPESSIHNDMNIISEAVSPTDLNLDCDEQQTPTSSNTQPKLLIEEVKSKSDELKYEVSWEEGEGIKKESSKSTKDGKKKQRWSSFRRKSTPSEEASNSANNCTDDAPREKNISKLRRILSSPCGVSALLVLMAIMYKRKKKEFFKGSPLQPDPAAMMMILHGRKKSIAYEGNSFFP